MTPKEALKRLSELPDYVECLFYSDHNNFIYKSALLHAPTGQVVYEFSYGEKGDKFFSRKVEKHALFIGNASEPHEGRKGVLLLDGNIEKYVDIMERISNEHST